MRPGLPAHCPGPSDPRTVRGCLHVAWALGLLPSGPLLNTDSSQHLQGCYDPCARVTRRGASDWVAMESNGMPAWLLDGVRGRAKCVGCKCMPLRAVSFNA